MFDFDIAKLAVIGVVALVVIGPERLPGVARTVGALLGRAQRYISDVKAEVAREIELDALRQMKSNLETAAADVERTIHDNLRRHEAELNAAWQAGAASATTGAATSGRPRMPPAVRKNWRVRQTALPSWYKRVSMKRTRVLSGAARVARHTPASLRRPMRFF